MLDFSAYPTIYWRTWDTFAYKDNTYHCDTCQRVLTFRTVSGSKLAFTMKNSFCKCKVQGLSLRQWKKIFMIPSSTKNAHWFHPVLLMPLGHWPWSGQMVMGVIGSFPYCSQDHMTILTWPSVRVSDPGSPAEQGKINVHFFWRRV